MTDYIAAGGFKTRHGITVTTHDTRIAAHCTAASREVDSMCRRSFGQHSGAATARYFRPLSSDFVMIDDAYEIAAVEVDDAGDGTYSTTWATTDYVTEPLNGVGPNGQAGWPASALLAIAGRCFPTSLPRPVVKVTAKWDWAVTPTDVIEATYLVANRLFYEVSVPSGYTPPDMAAGTPGAPLQRPYTVERLLKPYVRTDRSVGFA
jgi:hypothetical protein